MTSKERAYLIKLSSNLSPVLQLGKEGFTPEVTKALLEVLEARELIKINILKNSPEDPKEVARLIAERTSSELVQVIGRKAVLYKPNKDPKKRKIELNG